MLSETYIERLADESPNDRNDRAIRTAAAWYASHLKTHANTPNVHLWTDDVGNALRATTDLGLNVWSTTKLVEAFKDTVPELSDIHALHDTTSYDKGPSEQYVEVPSLIQIFFDAQGDSTGCSI